jgi:YggT family protein
MGIVILTLCGGIAGFLKFYMVLLMTRVYITWFPNINLYVQPWQSIGLMTNPYLRFFRGIIPTILGFDFSPLVGFMAITALIDVFSSIEIAA